MRVTLTADRGATIETWVYIVNDKREEFLLSEGDAVRLGIVKLDLKGATEEVVNKISHDQTLQSHSPSDAQTQQEIDLKMQSIVNQFPSVFTNTTGKPIKIQTLPDAVPVILTCSKDTSSLCG